MTPSPAEENARKRSASDFIFGKVIGEGSFSTVYLAKDIHTNKEFAIKVLDKRHIIREKKMEYVTREKRVLQLLSGSCDYFVKLYCTFQDPERLYFVLTYAKNGELLSYIGNNKGTFNMACTKYYSAELVLALEALNLMGIVHRDLKPENILFDENWHILITDFGSAKILNEERSNEATPRRRKNSFVGTAQYVSPELLTDSTASCASDLWALGCIIYQMVSGLPPFRAGSEYLIFKKILSLEYEFPEGFDKVAKDLVEKLLVLVPNRRLGAQETAHYKRVREHEFFDGLNWDSLGPPPSIDCTEPHMNNEHSIPDHLEPGFDGPKASRLQLEEFCPQPTSQGGTQDAPQGALQPASSLQPATSLQPVSSLQPANSLQPSSTTPGRKKSETKRNITELDPEEIEKRLEVQKGDKFHVFVEGNLILKKGLVDKRKGLFPRRRMLLLTFGPRLYYVDPANMVLKGEIPWSAELRTEARNFKTFFVHTPNRTYFLEDPEGYALEWCKAIDEVKSHYYPQTLS